MTTANNARLDISLVGATSPWGKITHATRYDDDIAFVSTASHGGFRVSGRSRDILIALHPDWSSHAGEGWYEEDMAANIVVVFAWRSFPWSNVVDSCLAILCNCSWYPAFARRMAKALFTMDCESRSVVAPRVE